MITDIYKFLSEMETHEGELGWSWVMTSDQFSEIVAVAPPRRVYPQTSNPTESAVDLEMFTLLGHPIRIDKTATGVHLANAELLDNKQK